MFPVLDYAGEAGPLVSVTEQIKRYLLRYPPICDAAFLGYLGYQRLSHYAGQLTPEEVASNHAASVLKRSESLLSQIPINGKRVLFFTVHGWSTHVAWESVMALGLRLRGAEPHFFLCGGGLSQCDSKHPELSRVNYTACYNCMKWGLRILNALRFPYVTLKDMENQSATADVERAIHTLPGDHLGAFSLNGTPLAEYVRPSLTRALGRGRDWPEQTDRDIHRGFLLSSGRMLSAVHGLLDDLQPRVVVMTNGLFFAERLMFEEALKRGIPVVTYEKAKHLDHVVVARNRPVVRYEMDEDWFVWKDRPLTPEEDRRLDESLGHRRQGKVGNEPLWTSMTQDREEVLERLSLNPAMPVVSLFTNVDWDTSVYGSNGPFPNMLGWVVETIRYFSEHPDLQLVVRVHPAEVRLASQISRFQAAKEIQRYFPVLPSNIRVVPPDNDISSYTLVDLSRFVVVYTSTIGLEAAVAGKPVLVAGRVHYGGRGFTSDAGSPDDYYDLLARFSSGTMPNSMSPTLARRYAYMFFHRFMHPLSAVHEEQPGRPLFVFNHLEDLMPGCDSSLDRICEFILRSVGTVPGNLLR